MRRENQVGSKPHKGEAPDLTPVPEKDLFTPQMLDDMARILGRRLAVYAQACQSSSAAELGLPLMDFQALEFIVEFEALSTGQLAHLIGLSRGGTTALLNRLEAAGYIVRDRGPMDGRVVTVRPVLERCEFPFWSESTLTEIVAAAARNNPAQLATVYDFLWSSTKTLKISTFKSIGMLASQY